MTNHPNRQRMPYAVRCGVFKARFSHYKEAMRYAKEMSADMRGYLAEVSDKTGIVGQYKNGATTEEFREHHHQAMCM